MKFPKPILDNVSGRISPQKLTAIYGPSGAGKTTLLNALAFRVPFRKNATFTG
jgi:ABC-type multidrug transport system ATPase subunit